MSSPKSFKAWLESLEKKQVTPKSLAKVKKSPNAKKKGGVMFGKVEQGPRKIDRAVMVRGETGRVKPMFPGHESQGRKPCPACGDWHTLSQHYSHGQGSFAMTHKKPSKKRK